MSLTYVLVIDEIPLYNVITYPDKYNSCNHGAKPDDYYTVLAQGNTTQWINAFHTDYSVINIYAADLTWMKEATKSGSYTGQFPEMFAEEKADMLQRYTNVNKYFDGTPYFVRCNRVSLKYGQHEVGPYTTFEEIIESLVTCLDTHTPLKETAPLTLFLLPWQTIDTFKEYRIFVYQNKITAISQQRLYEVNEFLEQYADDDERNSIIEKHVQIIQDTFDQTIKQQITHTQNYCMDAVLLDNDTLYFIEINSFGKEYAAGSALFHWITDEDILYGRHENTIHFRYTV